MNVKAMEDAQTAARVPPAGLACHAALTTPELLEAILGNLDMVTLLVSAQRVCRQWRAVISTPALQRYLFLEQNDAAKSTPKRHEGHLLMKQNPLLKKLFPSIFQTIDVPRRTLPTCTGFLTLLLGGCPLADRRDEYKRHHAFARKDASWRRMQVAQPPLRRVGYTEVSRLEEEDGMPADSESFRTLVFPEGLRMGELWDLLFMTIWDNCSRYDGSPYEDGPGLLILWKQYWPHSMRTPPKGFASMRKKIQMFEGWPSRVNLILIRDDERKSAWEQEFNGVDPWLVPSYSEHYFPEEHEWLYRCEDYDAAVLSKHLFASD